MKTKLIITAFLLTFLLVSCGSNRDILGGSSEKFIDKKIDSPFFGNKDSKVQMTIFTDFQCPACIQFEKTIGTQILKKYVDTNQIGLTYKMFPLSFHKNAPEDALAALCAASEGKFQTFAKEIYALEEIKEGASVTFLDRSNIAKKIGLDETKFKQCIDDGNYVSKIKEDMELWKKIGLKWTPSIYINGEIVDFWSDDEFFKILDTALMSENTQEEK